LAQVNTKTQTGSTPLHNAASNGHDACAALLLDAGCAVNARSHTGGPALVVAAAGGHAAVVQRLLAAGSELDAVTGSGATALHSAATVGHADVVAMLTAAGADLDVQVCAVGDVAAGLQDTEEQLGCFSSNESRELAVQQPTLV